MKLKKSRAESQRLLEERISKGRAFLPGATPNLPFEKFKSELEKWRSYNEDLLKTIYGDLELVVVPGTFR